MNEISEQIVANLRNGNRAAYETMYKENFVSVEKFITKNSGTIDDAKDIFQDTLLVLLEKLRADNFELTASLKMYIIAISRNLWFKKLRYQSYYWQTEFSETLSNKFSSEISLSINDEKSYWEKLQTYLSKITAHCNRLLQSMFFENKNIETIQKEYGYSSRHNAQNQKHKCIEQVRKVKEADQKEEIKNNF
jgi:DNA-directed RNA polymerase specialized sigma24 family protein